MRKSSLFATSLLVSLLAVSTIAQAHHMTNT